MNIDTSTMLETKSVSTAQKSTTSGTTSAGNSLGPDDFLTLLMAQLQTQDPSNPMDTQAMVNQLSTMEMVAETRAGRQSQEFSQATSLLGRQVTWQGSDSSSLASGTVTSVIRQDSDTYLVVGGQSVALSSVLTVT